jgi:hypothetical protein
MRANVFEWLSHPWWTLVLFAVLTVVLIGVMQRQGASLKIPGVVPRGIGDLELAGTSECAAKILNAWEPAGTHVAIVNTLLDFLFIPCYTTTLALIFFWLASVARQMPVLPVVLLVWAWLMWVAGILDVIENLCMLGMLTTGASAVLARVAQVCATVKFLITLILVNKTLLAKGACA